MCYDMPQKAIYSPFHLSYMSEKDLCIKVEYLTIANVYHGLFVFQCEDDSGQTIFGI